MLAGTHAEFAHTKATASGSASFGLGLSHWYLPKRGAERLPVHSSEVESEGKFEGVEVGLGRTRPPTSTLMKPPSMCFS